MASGDGHVDVSQVEKSLSAIDAIVDTLESSVKCPLCLSPYVSCHHFLTSPFSDLVICEFSQSWFLL